MSRNRPGENAAERWRSLTVQEATTAAIHHPPSGVPIKALAEAMSVPYNTLTDIADEHRPRRLYADEIPTLVRETGSTLVLDVLEAKVGRVAYALPAATSTGDQQQLARTAKEFGELLQAAAEAMTDGRWQSAEVQRLEQEGYELIAAVCALVESARRRAREGHVRVEVFGDRRQSR